MNEKRNELDKDNDLELTLDFDDEGDNQELELEFDNPNQNEETPTELTLDFDDDKEDISNELNLEFDNNEEKPNYEETLGRYLNRNAEYEDSNTDVEEIDLEFDTSDDNEQTDDITITQVQEAPTSAKEDRDLKALAKFRKKIPASEMYLKILNLLVSNKHMIVIYGTSTVERILDSAGSRSAKSTDRFVKSHGLKGVPPDLISYLYAYANKRVDDDIIAGIQPFKGFKPEDILEVDLYKLVPDLEYHIPDIAKQRIAIRNKSNPNGPKVATLYEVIDSEIIYGEIINHFSKFIECKYEDAQMVSANNSNIATLANKYMTQYAYAPEFLRNMNLSEEDIKAVYVEKVNLATNKFVCGCCGEENELKVPFYRVLIIPGKLAGNDVGNVRDTSTILNIPAMNDCKHCGAINMLSEKEVKRLERAFRRAHDREELDKFRTRNLELCSGFTVTSYTFGSEMLADILPNVFDLVEETEVDEEETTTVVDYTEALKHYREMKEYFKNAVISKTISNNVEKEIAVDDTFEQIMGEVHHSKYTETGYEINRRHNLDTLVKVIAGILGRKFKDLKQDAVSSLLKYIGEGSLYNKLSFRNTKRLEGIILSKDILKYFDGLSEADRNILCERVCDALSINPKEYLDADGKIIQEKYSEFIAVANENFSRLEQEHIKYIKDSEKLIDNLKDLEKLYSFIPISKANVIKKEVYEDLFYDERIVNFIDETSNLMILNHLAIDFASLWKSRMKSTNRIKEITNIANDKQQIADKLNDFLTGIDDDWRDHVGGYSLTRQEKVDLGVLSKIGNFLCKEKINTNNLYKLSSIKDNLINYDEFKLRNAIKNCDFILGNEFDTWLLKPIRDLVGDEIQSCTEFTNKYGTTSLDRFKYIFRNLFTPEEIEEDYEDFFENTTLEFLVPRKDGESFKDYMERYIDIDWDKLPISEYHLIDNSYAKHFESKLAVVYACPLLYLAFSTMARELGTFIFMSDLLYFILNEPIDKILFTFKIDIEVANRLLSTSTDYHLDKDIDYRKIELDSWLMTIVYLDDHLNSLILANDDIDELDTGLTGDEAKIQSLVSDMDILEEGMRHINKGVIDLLNEYYSPRG